MATSGAQEDPLSTSSSSEPESEESRGEEAEAESERGPHAIRVVPAGESSSASERDEKDEGQRERRGAERREEEEEGAGERFFRGEPRVQSVRARKPKKKIYAKSKGAQKKKTKTTTGADEQERVQVNTQQGQREQATESARPSQPRAINVQPSAANYSSSDSDSEESDIDVGPEQDASSESSTHVLTQREMEEGQGEGGGVFSRFRDYAGSFRIKLSNKDRKKLEELESEESDPENLEGVFEMMRPEDQPDVLKKDTDFRRRANKAVASVVTEMMPKPEEKEKEPSALSKLCSCFERKEKEEKKEKKKPGEKRKPKPPATQLSPQLQKASSQGTKMMKKVFFPALPHLLQDFWVFLEFAITIFAFVFGLLSLDFEDGSKAFNIFYFTLTIISIILALIDGFIYFVQMGSCAECVRICYAKLKKRNNGENNILLEIDEETQTKKCCRMSKEKKEKFNTYFELVRNLISEGILYPLLICDLFDFIVGGVFRNVSTDDRLNFTLFVVGSLYLILSVYVMRMFLIIGSLLSLRRLPPMPNASGSGGDNIKLLKWFSGHILCQVITHAILIICVSLKIRNENPNHGEQDGVYVSGFLWAVVVLGGLIPLAGIVSFFITNYYHMKEFSISFWIDMMSLLQAPSFTDTVFQSGGTDAPSELAEDFVKNSELKKVKKHFERYKSPRWYVKYFFPLRLPLLVIMGLVYTLGLVTFLVSLIVTQNPPAPTSTTIELVIFEDYPLTAAFFLCAIILFLFNMKIVILMTVFIILLVLFLISATLMIAIMLPIVLLIYLPVGFCVGCLQCCRSTVKEVNIFETPGVSINYYNAV